MSPLRTLPCAAALCLLAACSQQPVRLTAPTPTPTPAPAPAAATVAVPAAVTPAAKEKLPDVALSPRLLYQFLISEIAGQRGMIGVAEQGYITMARETGDPRIARRAADIAFFAQNYKDAEEASRIWLKGDPGSLQAMQTLAASQLAQNQFAAAEPVLRTLLTREGAPGFMQLSVLLAKTTDPEGAYRLLQRLTAPYPQMPEAWFALAQAALKAGHPVSAQADLTQADKLRPGWEPVALLRTQMLAARSAPEALAYLGAYLQRYPQAQDIRLVYARLLVAAGRFLDARAQFAILAKQLPNNSEIAYAAGLLALQTGDFSVAREELERAAALRFPGKDALAYYLGLTEEGLGHPADALVQYRKVARGEYLVAARSRMADIMAKEGKLGEARALLQATRPATDAQRIQLIQAQADLLRNAKDYVKLYELLSESLKRFPESPELLYDHSMVAEKLGKLGVVETDLRKVIRLQPDNAQAYNALGYTLAEKTNRLKEAAELLDKALSLAPDDPFILDSVGWLNYRQGNLARAREYLERAYKLRADPEIAAHLGEVLWMQGSHQAALNLWKASLQSHPQNEALLQVLKKFNP